MYKRIIAASSFVRKSKLIIGLDLIADMAGKAGPAAKAEKKRLEEEAKTAILVAIDGRIAGVIAVADTLKEDSVQAIRELEKMGIETAMITGDNRGTAEAIAKKVGISRI